MNHKFTSSDKGGDWVKIESNLEGPWKKKLAKMNSLLSRYHTTF
ncbi:hypothetical protein N9B38_02500 [bacterium]|nr:hypothetical protein [bacterium]